MADVTLGFKVSEEVKEKAKQTIEASGMSAKDWIQSALVMYEAKNIQLQAPEFVISLQELEVHTTRINELVINMVQQALHLKEQAVRDVLKESTLKDSLVTDLQEKIRDMKQQAQATHDENATLRESLEQLAAQLADIKQAYTTQEILLQEYTVKVATLAEEVIAYETLKEKWNTLKKEHTAEVTSLKASYEQQLDAEKVTYTNDLQQQHAITNDAVQQIQQLQQQIQQYEQQQQLTEAQHNMALQQAVIEAERKYQSQLQQQMDVYNDKLFQLMTTTNSDQSTEV